MAPYNSSGIIKVSGREYDWLSMFEWTYPLTSLVLTLILSPPLCITPLEFSDDLCFHVLAELCIKMWRPTFGSTRLSTMNRSLVLNEEVKLYVGWKLPKSVGHSASPVEPSNNCARVVPDLRSVGWQPAREVASWLERLPVNQSEHLARL